MYNPDVLLPIVICPNLHMYNLDVLLPIVICPNLHSSSTGSDTKSNRPIHMLGCHNVTPDFSLKPLVSRRLTLPVHLLDSVNGI